MTYNPKIIRKQVRFFGRVQAVGFRFQAQNAARRYGTTGWVLNEYDGSVTLQLQGTESQINDVISEIDSDPYIRIERMETEYINVIPDEKSFRIMH